MPDPRTVVERLMETINAHDVAGGRSLYSPNLLAVTATGRHLDLDGVDAMLRASLASFPDLQVRVVRWITDGDMVVTEELLEGTHRGTFAGLAATGRRVRLPVLHVTRVREGRIVERIAYHDTAGVLRQLKEDATATR
jgi:aspartyl-tRNA synthetase